MVETGEREGVPSGAAVSEYYPLAPPPPPAAGTPALWVLNVLRGAPYVIGATRALLCRWSGLPDRTIRDAVRGLRDAGFPVCSSSASTEPGYWLSTDAAEVEACAEREYGSRVRSELHTRSTMRRAARRLRALAEAREPVQERMAL